MVARRYGESMRRLLFRPVAAGAALLGAILVVGCSPTSEPDPIPTPLFQTDEEAFAAAEATYRAYVDALNSFRAGVQVEPFNFLTGEALESGVNARRQLEDSGVRIEGVSILRSFTGQQVTPESIVSFACVDASETRVVATNGTDRTPASRSVVSGFEIRFIVVGGELHIASSTTEENACLLR